MPTAEEIRQRERRRLRDELRRRWRGRRPKPKPVRARDLPRTIERAYLADLLRLLEPMHRLVLERVAPLIADVGRERADNVDPDAFRAIGKTIAGVRLEYMRTLSMREIQAIAARRGREVDAWQRGEMQRQARAALSIDIRRVIPGGEGELKAWTRANVELIKTVPERYFAQLEDVVRDGYEHGRRASTIQALIEERFSVSQSNAARIARDQVLSLNGELNQSRQTAVGIQAYIWGASNDERVRPEHAERDGKRYLWTHQHDDGHPGYPILCRCQALPDFNGFLDWLEGVE